MRKAWAALIRYIFDYGYCDLCKKTAALRHIKTIQKEEEGKEKNQTIETPTEIKVAGRKICDPCWLYLGDELRRRNK